MECQGFPDKLTLQTLHSDPGPVKVERFGEFFDFYVLIAGKPRSILRVVRGSQYLSPDGGSARSLRVLEATLNPARLH